MNAWPSFTTAITSCLDAAECTDGRGVSLPMQAGFEEWVTRSRMLAGSRGGIFFVGNGASSSMASHYAADVGKNAGFKTTTFTDAVLMTAIGNDICFSQVFAEPLRRSADASDMLVAISSSGNSQNILEAARVAREKSMYVVTLTGMRRDNQLRSLGDCNFWIPADLYGMVETAHFAVLHYWTDRLCNT
jgi:Phosphoheptose isomerase